MSHPERGNPLGPARERIFVALQLAPECSAELLDEGRAWAGARVEAFRWSRVEALHLTLLFVGSVPPNVRGALARELERAWRGARTPRLRLDPLGAFPKSTRARVLWKGVEEDGRDALVALRSRTYEAAACAGLETALDADAVRAFRPHITLARSCAGAGVGGLGAPPAGAPRTWLPTAGALLRSQRSAAGAEYERLLELPLGPLS